MNDKREHDRVRSRNEPFVERMATRLWHERASDDNPYITERVECHGYDLFELMEKRSFVDVFFLLFRAELPTADEEQLLQALMIALVNPGPRHPAVRAAINVGIGKSDPAHILPVAAGILGGDYLGGGGVEAAMRFFRKHQNDSADNFFSQNPLFQYQETGSVAQSSAVEAGVEGEKWRAMPGMGSFCGGIDSLTREIAQRLLVLPAAGAALKFGADLATRCAPYGGGWLMPGLAAAVFADLGFQPRIGGCLFQLLASPGCVAHGFEVANKAITAMPFVSDENYVIER